MHSAAVVTKPDFLTIDKPEIICSARINLDGHLVKFNPPQTMIASPLRKGARWDFNGQAGARTRSRGGEGVGGGGIEGAGGGIVWGAPGEGEESARGGGESSRTVSSRGLSL